MRRIKTLVLLSALLAVAGAAGVASAGKAPYRMTFYNDAGEVVGMQVGTCSGSYYVWGERTDHYTIEYLPCEP